MSDSLDFLEINCCSIYICSNTNILWDMYVSLGIFGDQAYIALRHWPPGHPYGRKPHIWENLGRWLGHGRVQETELWGPETGKARFRGRLGPGSRLAFFLLLGRSKVANSWLILICEDYADRNAEQERIHGYHFPETYDPEPWARRGSSKGMRWSVGSPPLVAPRTESGLRKSSISQCGISKGHQNR